MVHKLLYDDMHECPPVVALIRYYEIHRNDRSLDQVYWHIMISDLYECIQGAGILGVCITKRL